MRRLTAHPHLSDGVYDWALVSVQHTAVQQGQIQSRSRPWPYTRSSVRSQTAYSPTLARWSEPRPAPLPVLHFRSQPATSESLQDRVQDYRHPSAFPMTMRMPRRSASRSTARSRAQRTTSAGSETTARCGTPGSLTRRPGASGRGNAGCSNKTTCSANSAYPSGGARVRQRLGDPRPQLTDRENQGPLPSSFTSRALSL